jgi:acetolactate synthase-1/2/3 large subunit
MDDTRTETTSVAEAYLKALSDSGIRYVFANAGTDFAPIIEALAKSGEMGRQVPEFMTVPHENVAVHMAAGYWETSGEMAAVMVHVTVGTANAVCGIMNASRENVPMLLAAGRTPLTETGNPASRNGVIHWGQESFDQGGMVREYVKWDYELRHGQPAADIVGRAVNIAMSDPKGPVYLTLPREVLAGEAVTAGAGMRGPATGNLPTAPAAEAIEQAADMIAGGDNVLIAAGTTGRDSAAAFEALATLAGDHAIAVCQLTNHNLPTSHDMNLGMPTQELLEWADVIIAMDAQVPWIPSAMSPGADTKMIHMAVDPMYARYPTRGWPMDLAVAGSSAAALPLLNAALGPKLKSKSKTVDRRRAKIKAMRDAMLARQAARIEEVRSLFPIHPVWSAHCVNQVKDADTILVNEIGVPMPYLQVEQSGRLLGNSGAGGLGRALGAALGAKLAKPEAQVIAAMGDGSYMFGVPIAAHYVSRAHNLPVLNMISNNAQWLAVRASTLAVYPDGHASRANAMPITELSPSPDYEKGIATVDGYGEKVEDPEKLIPALERGLKHTSEGTPVVLNVITQAARG